MASMRSARRRALPAALAALALAFAGAAAAQEGAAPDQNQNPQREQALQRLLQQVDKNGDQAISTEESKAAQRQRFAALDASGDGALTQQEFLAPLAAAEIPADRKARIEAVMVEAFVAMDEDKNAGVSEAEFLSAGRQRFVSVDTNGDGMLTLDELRAARL